MTATKLDREVQLAANEDELEAWDLKNGERLAKAKADHEAAEKAAEKVRAAVNKAARAAVERSGLGKINRDGGRTWTPEAIAALEREIGWKFKEQGQLDGRHGNECLMEHVLTHIERRIEDADPEVQRTLARWKRLRDTESRVRHKLRDVERERWHIESTVSGLKYQIEERQQRRAEREAKKKAAGIPNREYEEKRAGARRRVHALIGSLTRADADKLPLPEWVAGLRKAIK